MAKFRKNHGNSDHNRKGKKSFKFKAIRMLFLFLGILLLLFVLSTIDAPSWDAPKTNNSSRNSTISDNVELSSEKLDGISQNYLPESTTGQVVKHKHYTISYDEDHEQAEWVAYKLTKESLQAPNVPREKRYNPDYAVTTRSAFHRDYTHSGYTRGHLAPAGDMAFSTEAMKESFFMSNMSPQLKEFNGGIWRELEESVRDWAYDYDELFIVSGPILTKGHILKKIGQNKVSVPDTFYKIILDNKGPDIKMVAFLIPNEKSTKSLKEYVVTVDKIEEITGINFFADFLDSEIESELESSNNIKPWKLSNKRFQKRIRQWNNR